MREQANRYERDQEDIKRCLEFHNWDLKDLDGYIDGMIAKVK